MLALDLEKPLLDAGGHYVDPGRPVRRGDRPRDREGAPSRWTGCSRCSRTWTSASRGVPRRWPRRRRSRRDRAARGRGRRGRPGTPPMLRTSSTRWSRQCPPGSSSAPTDGRRASAGARARAAQTAPRHGRWDARRRARRLPAEQMSLGTEGDLYYLVFPARTAGAALPAPRPGPARPLRRAGPTGDVPGRLPVPLPARRGGLPAGRPAGRARLPDERHLDRRPCAPVSCSSATRRAGTTRSSVRACRSRCGTCGWWPTSSAPARTARSPRSLPTCRSGGSGCVGSASPRRSQTALVATFTPSGAARREAFNRCSAPTRCSAARGWRRSGAGEGAGGSVRPGERRAHPGDGVTRDLVSAEVGQMMRSVSGKAQHAERPKRGKAQHAERHCDDRDRQRPVVPRRRRGLRAARPAAARVPGLVGAVAPPDPGARRRGAPRDRPRPARVRRERPARGRRGVRDGAPDR